MSKLRLELCISAKTYPYITIISQHWLKVKGGHLKLRLNINMPHPVHIGLTTVMKLTFETDTSFNRKTKNITVLTIFLFLLVPFLLLI